MGQWTKLFFKGVLIGGIVIQTLGCARTEKFERSEKYYDPEPESFYYSKQSGQSSPTARVEQMGQPKKRIVVFDFWNDTPLTDPKIGEFAANELRRELFNTKRVILPKELEIRLSTKDFIDGQNVRVAQLIREGRSMGVAVLAIGRVAKITFRQRGDEVGIFRQKQSIAAVDVEVKVFDVGGGREIMAMGRSGVAGSSKVISIDDDNVESRQFRSELARLAIRKAVRPLVGDVMTAIEKLSWSGKIAKIVGTKVYVNAGKNSGLVGGDILKVLTPSEEIYDPDTGAFLGKAEGQLKGTLEVVDFIGSDASVAVVHTGGNVTEGDIVKLY